MWDEDLPEIADRIKDGSDITLDLSETKITKIGEKAFKSCEALKAIILPKVLTGIGDRVFYRCTSLATIDVASGNKNYASVDGVLFSKDKKTLLCFPEGKITDYYEIPEGVTSIGDDAFNWCTHLWKVTIPNSVTSIGKQAFWQCKALAKVEIPNSVTSIGDKAFSKCGSLAHITIPSSVTSIGKGAFIECSSLKKIEFADESVWYFDMGFTRRAVAAELASSLKDGEALYKKTR